MPVYTCLLYPPLQLRLVGGGSRGHWSRIWGLEKSGRRPMSTSAKTPDSRNKGPRWDVSRTLARNECLPRLGRSVGFPSVRERKLAERMSISWVRRALPVFLCPHAENSPGYRSLTQHSALGSCGVTHAQGHRPAEKGRGCPGQPRGSGRGLSQTPSPMSPSSEAAAFPMSLGCSPAPLRPSFSWWEGAGVLQLFQAWVPPLAGRQSQCCSEASLSPAKELQSVSSSRTHQGQRLL